MWWLTVHKEPLSIPLRSSWQETFRERMCKTPRLPCHADQYAPRLHSIQAVCTVTPRVMRLFQEVQGVRRRVGVEVDSREADHVEDTTSTMSLLRRPVTSHMYQARVSRGGGLNWGGVERKIRGESCDAIPVGSVTKSTAVQVSQVWCIVAGFQMSWEESKHSRATLVVFKIVLRWIYMSSTGRRMRMRAAHTP